MASWLPGEVRMYRSIEQWFTLGTGMVYRDYRHPDTVLCDCVHKTTSFCARLDVYMHAYSAWPYDTDY